MSRAGSPSEISPAHIPKITDLRKQLAYGDSGLSRCIAFTDDLRVFRRRYSVAGLRGIDLCDWRLPRHQEALKQMTSSFLDQEGHGERYWPSDPTAANFNSLQYSTHRTFINQTMRKLIFRMNLQQYRNAKYKKKDVQYGPEVIDQEDELPNSRPDRSDSSVEILSMSAATATPMQTHTGGNVAARLPLAAEGSFRQDHDIYEVPTSPEYVPEKNSITKRKLKAPTKSSPQKRSKIVSLKVGNGKPPRHYLRSIAPMPKRTSPRGKTTVPPVNYVDRLDLDQFSTSVISTTEPTLGPDSVTGAGHQDQANVQQRSEKEDIFNYRITTQSLMRIGSTPPTSAVSITSANVDPNIDPNLDRISSTEFHMNPPMQQASHQSRPSWSNPPLTHVGPSNSIQPEAEQAPSSTRSMSMSTIESMHGTNKTPIPLYPSPVPSDAKKPAKEVPSTTISRPAVASSTDSKAGISFNYRVILSRTPIYQAKSWHPKGHFLEKSLSELIDELPFENKGAVIGLIIQLTGPGVAVEETVARGEDGMDNYSSTKKELMQVVKMCLKKHSKAKPGSRLEMNFKIEAVREGGVDEDAEDDDDVLLF
ncbi:uncharacterized protein CC84DRAFT_1259120 [Paraphaeosphaeria sporulosa]|uniref:Uncharacterized protein n=1 Tax=Paraphaeosphaeria sporulosa TaxID=1460663 RepID=A0A177CEJ9_9PLEO|nr:uncharacterized protein CC84DRAFT_1259120 [Paraphaeosphaeria sporulosa]OAG05736.1 hypothetical protein CC84DRAFT_1259120 [Paraphaeosphaeria sporulosa]